MWLVELILIAYLPGALIYRLPVAARDRRATLPVEERVFWGLLISVAWSSVLALSLAAAGHYSLFALLAGDLLLCGALVVAGRQHLLYRGTAARPTWHLLAPLLLVALGAWLYFPPAEYVIGGKDPGVYVNEGVALAQRGALGIEDDVAASVPALSRDMFFPSYRNPTYYSSRFMGFFLVSPITGTVVGQFPHLYPAWIAIGYGLLGLTGALSVVGAWSIVGLLAIYLTGARLLGRLAAFWGTALFGISIVTVWFSRYPNSETVMLALLFAALLAYARAHVDEDSFFAPVAGVLLGLLLFLRFDAVLALGAVGVTVVLLFVIGRAPRLTFLLPVLLSSGLGWIYYSRWMRPYIQRPLVFVQQLRPVHIAALIGAALVLGLLLVLARRPAIRRALRASVPAMTASVIAVAALYAYFFRQAGGRLAAHDADSLRTFTWYFPAPALLLSVVGFALVAWKRFWRDPALMLTASVYALFVFYKIQIVPEHLWMTRRFLPVILPAACLLFSAGAFYRWWSGEERAGKTGPVTGSHRWMRPLASLVLPTLMVASVAVVLWRAAAPVRGHVEYAGIVPKLESLVAHIGDRDLLLVEARRSSDLHVVALPLAYIYARNVLVFANPRPDPYAFRDFLTWAQQRYDRVFFAGGGGMDLLSRNVSVVPVASELFQVPEYQSARNAYPLGVRRKEFDFSLYRFLEGGEAARGPVAVDVGTLDDLFVVRFHAKERKGDLTYRWTSDVSYVSLVGIQPDAATLSIWFGDGGRDASAVGIARVTLDLDGQRLGEAEVRGGFRPYTFALPPDLVRAAARRDAPALLKISSTTFNLQKLAGIPDDRNLGVMVDRVAVQ